MFVYKILYYVHVCHLGFCFTVCASGDSELDYVMFFRSSRHSSEMDFGDNEDSGQEENADTPRPSLTDTTASRARDKAKVSNSVTLCTSTRATCLCCMYEPYLALLCTMHMHGNGTTCVAH